MTYRGIIPHWRCSLIGSAAFVGVLAGAAPAAAQQIAPLPAPVQEVENTGDESLRDTIVASLRQNPEIQVALAQQDDARYGIAEARAGYLPRVDLTVSTGPEYVRLKGVDPTYSRRADGTVTLHQNIWDFGVTINDIKRARAAYLSAQWGTRGQIEQVSFDIASAYLNVFEKQRLLVLIDEEIVTQAKLTDMISVQKELGLTTGADVDRAKVRSESLKQLKLDTQSQWQQQREAYRRLTGHLPGKTAEFAGLDAALPHDVDAAVEMISGHSPQLAQAMQDRRSIDRQLASQNGNFFPKIALDLQGNYKDEVLGRTGRNSDARAVVTLSYNIFNGGADLAIRNRIRARLRESDYQLDRIRRDVEQDLRIDFQSMEAARAKMTTIEAQRVAAENVVVLYREQFRAGQRSVFDLLDSQQALFDARRNEITNYTQKEISGFRVLQKLAGLFDFISRGEPLPNLTVAPPKIPARP